MSRNCARLFELVAAIAIAAPGLAIAGTVRDGSHDMDFAIGKWRTEVTVINDPFNHPDRTVRMSGTKTARPVWNGRAVFEEIEADGPDGHWQAANLFLYDPVAHQWSQNYVDSNSAHFDAAPGIGGYRNGDLEFHWQAKIDGRDVLERGTWTDFTPTTHTYRVERSNDGGRSWHVSFIARVTRMQ